MPYTDYMMIDPYPAPEFPLSYVRECYREAAASSGGAKRVFGVGQSFDWYESVGLAPPNHEWRPTVHEMRNITYQYMVLGANGLFYFAYSYVHNQPDRWAGLVGIANEVKQLMPLLVLPNSDKQVVEEPDTLSVDYSLKELDGVFYLMLVSTWFDDVTLSYDLSALGDNLCVINYFNEETVPVKNGKVTLTIPKEGDAVLQIIPK